MVIPPDLGHVCCCFGWERTLLTRIYLYQHNIICGTEDMERVKSPSLIECSINRLLSLEPASPPAHSTSQQLWSNSLDFDLDSLGGVSKGNNHSSNLSVHKPQLPKKQQLPPLQKASSTLTASTAAPTDHKKHQHIQEHVQMHPIPVKSVPLLVEPDSNPKLVHRDTMVQSHFFDSAPMESFNERDFHSSKLSLATIGLIAGESQPDPIRPGYIFKPVQGKQFSKTVRLSSPLVRSTDKFSLKNSLSTMSLSPVHRQELEEGSISLKPDNLDGSVSDGLLSRGSLQIGLPEEVSRLPSPNLQVPMLPIHTHFDDEGFLSSEFQSEREPLPAEQFPPNSLDNPFSLDISEKPMDEGNNVTMEQVSPDAGPATREKANRMIASRNTRLMRSTHTTSPGDLQTTSTVSTLGDANVVPYAVHRRILGWKLTSVEKRRELVDIMDAVHGNASPDLQVRLRKSKLLRGGDSMADAQLTAFGGSKSLPNLRSTMAASRSQLDPFMLRAKTRQTIAYEDFVTRSVNSRQGFRSVQQIKNFVEDQKKKKEERDRIISAQKQQQQRQSVSPLHLDFDFAGPDPIADPQSRSLTVRPYIPVGTLTSADKFGKSTDTVTLQSLLAEALFADGEFTAEEDTEAAKQFATANMSAAERLYNYPVGVHRPRSRMVRFLVMSYLVLLPSSNRVECLFVVGYFGFRSHSTRTGAGHVWWCVMERGPACGCLHRWSSKCTHA